MHECKSQCIHLFLFFFSTVKMQKCTAYGIVREKSVPPTPFLPIIGQRKSWICWHHCNGNLQLVNTLVSCKYDPPFATLASVQNAGGGAYAWDAKISLAITPSFLVLVKHDLLLAQGIAEREAERCSGRYRASALRGKEAGRFREVSIVDAGSLHSH